jgi:isoquinoline 1-oxidoreductase alpha subunit
MILNAVRLLKENPQPSQQEIIRAMDNNLCRCGAYGRIIEAIESASRKQTGGK